MNIVVTPRSGHHGLLRTTAHRYVCMLGPAGVVREKREGDGATPAGTFPLRAIWYRADRMEQPATVLPLHEIRQHDGWCDAPEDKNYNRPVQLPYPASAERMWRTDGVYDLVIVLGHNDDPVTPGHGSAIFMHIANPEFGPTEGCVALHREDLVTLVNNLTRNSMIEIRVA